MSSVRAIVKRFVFPVLIVSHEGLWQIGTPVANREVRGRGPATRVHTSFVYPLGLHGGKSE
jgi:hypothetical protein